MLYIEGRELMALRRSVNFYVEPIDINSYVTLFRQTLGFPIELLYRVASPYTQVFSVRLDRK